MTYTQNGRSYSLSSLRMCRVRRDVVYRQNTNCMPVILRHGFCANFLNKLQCHLSMKYFSVTTSIKTKALHLLTIETSFAKK